MPQQTEPGSGTSTGSSETTTTTTTCVPTWPWPMSVVECWLYDLYDWVGRAAALAGNAAVSAISDLGEFLQTGIADTSKWVLDGTTEIILDLQTGISDLFDGANTALATGIDTITTGFTDAVTNLGTWWNDIATTLFNDLGVKIDDIPGLIQPALDGFSVLISGNYANLIDRIDLSGQTNFDSMSGLAGDILDGFADKFKDALSFLWSTLGDVAGPVAQGIFGIIGDVKDTIADAFSPLFTSILDEMSVGMSAGSPPPEIKAVSTTITKNMLDVFQRNIPTKLHSPPSIADLQFSAGEIVTGMVGVYVLTSVLSGAMDAIHPLKDLGIKAAAMEILHAFSISSAIAPLIQSELWAGLTVPFRMRMQQKYPYQVPSQNQLAQYINQRLIDETLYLDSMGLNGFDADWSGVMQQASKRVPSYGDMQNMYWRGAISLDDILDAERYMSLEDKFVSGYQALIEQVPNTQDLISMVIREAFQVRGGDDEMPEQFVTLMAKKGYTREQCLWYWRMHWNLPSLGNVYEMYHRDIQMPQTVQEFLKVADYATEWRGPLEQLSWSLPGSIEQRWMMKWGTITHDDLVELLKADGLAEEWRVQVADAIVRNVFVSDINKLRDNARSDFAKGYILEPQMRLDLSALGYSQIWIEYIVQDVLDDAERAYKDAQVENYLAGYAKDLITDADLETSLKQFIKNPDILNATLDKAWVKKYAKPK